jgi:hypothetical protein
MRDCQADGGDDGHPVGELSDMSFVHLMDLGVFSNLHSIEDHEFTFTAHKLAAPSAGHFGETVDLVSWSESKTRLVLMFTGTRIE